jgi:two-component system sensor histidine kinase DctS
MAVIRDLAPLIDLQAKRLKAIVKVQGMTGTHIVADKTMMEQVILNLVRNGLEAMRNTPEDKRLLTIEVSRDDALLNIRITDQGSGIAPELRDRIFSAFVTNKPKGTGVGLSLCKSLVEKHRGHISFSDNPKGGTIFTVELPIELSKSSEVSALRNAVEVVS